MGAGRDHRPQGWEGPGDAGVTTGTGLSPRARLHAFQGTILKEHVCVLSNVFPLIPQKYECLGEKASPWGWVWGAVPWPPWCSVRTTATGREEAGTPAAGRWAWDSLCHQLPRSRRARALTMAPRLVINVTLPRRLCVRVSPVPVDAQGLPRVTTGTSHAAGTALSGSLFCFALKVNSCRSSGSYRQHKVIVHHESAFSTA